MTLRKLINQMKKYKVEVIAEAVKVHPETIRRIIRGENKPSLDNYIKLVKFVEGD